MSTTGQPHRPAVNADVSLMLLVPSPIREKCTGCVFDEARLKNHNITACPACEEREVICCYDGRGNHLPQDMIWIMNTPKGVAAYVALRLGS